MPPEEPLMPPDEPPMPPEEPLMPPDEPPMLPDEPEEPEEPEEPDEPDEPELDGKGVDPPPELPLESELLLSGLLIGELDPQAANKTAAHNATSRCNNVLDLFTIITR